MASPWCTIKSNLNFFRLHLLFFTFTPLIASAIFYAANGRYHIRYIDALFTCVSAITASGLVTVNLSSLTGFQQAILFVLSILGSPVFVSWVTVYIRRRYFQKFIIAAETARRKSLLKAKERSSRTRSLSIAFRSLARALSSVPEGVDLDEEKAAVQENEKTEGGLGSKALETRVTPRVDAKPTLAIPNRWTTEGLVASPSDLLTDAFMEPGSDRKSSMYRGEGQGSQSNLQPLGSLQGTSTAVSNVSSTNCFDSVDSRRSGAIRRTSNPQTQDRPRPKHSELSVAVRQSTLQSGMGGFPYPHQLFSRFLYKIFPNVHRRLELSLTISHGTTISSMGGSCPNTGKAVRYVSFDATIGRNSKFLNVTEENLMELGGVEYRALDALLWVILLYHFGSHLIGFAIVAPYMSLPRWRGDFEPPNQIRVVKPVWFSAFQVVASFSNTGMSLVDQSMAPFQKSYPMIFAMIFLIIAGQSGFPVLLRLVIWTLAKLIPSQSRLYQTLHFLLDHPRRCFLYLFPSHQTWFLLTVICILLVINWFCFLVLDIGDADIEAIPIGVRVLDGLFQAAAARVAGFIIVSISQLTPAVQVLLVLMMYIAVYPVALSVRSTNVYEERSLCVDDNSHDDEFTPEGSRVAVWGKYLAWHARRQLAFDMWWLWFALFLICIIERAKIQDPNNALWFTIFSIIFEIVSAYGNVGLSFGVPYDNFAFSGAFSTLSKLIMCAVMLRGRHRGLPSAIDRAIILPPEFFTKPAEGKGKNNSRDPPIDGIPVSNTTNIMSKE